MRSKRMSINKRLAALGLAVAMVFTGVAATDMGSVQAAQAKAGVYHIYGASRYETAISVAEQLRTEMGVEQFDAVIVATGENFADALSGSYLSYVQNAPILLINDDSANNVKSYIKKYLKTEGTVYVLGGTGAVPEYLVDFSNAAGDSPFEVVRLSGKDRYATNIAILEEAGISGETNAGDILVCTGKTFADSLSASAAKKPILLVDQDLSNAQKEFLGSLKGDNYYVIGGTGAITSATKDQIEVYGTATRIKGADRYATSVVVANTFVKNPEAVVIAYGENFPDGLCGGFLATTTDGAVILANQKNAASVAAAESYITTKKIGGGYVLGGSAVFSQDTIADIFNVDKTKITTVKWTADVK